jgi:hypothetical protein
LRDVGGIAAGRMSGETIVAGEQMSQELQIMSFDRRPAVPRLACRLDRNVFLKKDI